MSKKFSKGELQSPEAAKFVKVTKHSALMLMYILVDNKYYGGIRYRDPNDEDEVRDKVLTMYQQGEWWDATDEVDYHRFNGRLVEELN